LKISDISDALQIKLLRDGIFKNLGKLNALDEADTLSFITDEKYIPQLQKTDKVSSVIVKEAFSDQFDFFEGGIILSENPKSTFFEIHRYLIDNDLYFKSFETSIDPSAKIAKTAIIAERNVIIGANVIIEDYVVIKENTQIGENTRIRSGTVVSSSGFETDIIDGVQKIIPHAGWVIIGKNVEIQANNAISRGLFPSRNTILADEVVTDNLVHIAHGVQIGWRTKIAASAMIAGSVTLGEKVWIGPVAVISSGITIGNEAKITLGSVVTRNVSENKRVTGNFAIDHGKFLENLKNIR